MTRPSQTPDAKTHPPLLRQPQAEAADQKLAEQVVFNTNVRVQTLIPWFTGETPGFVLSGVQWSDADAAQHARSGTTKSDYVVVTHLKPVTDPWFVELRLVRTIDEKCLGTLSATFPSARPEQGIPSLAQELFTLLQDQAEAEIVPPPSSYQLPSAAYFAQYMLRLEQLLAVRCGGMDGIPSGFFHGEREVIDGNLHLCVEHPQNIGARILLAQTVAGLKKIRPAMIPEFREKLALLQKEKPLAEPAQGVVQRIINESLAT